MKLCQTCKFFIKNNIHALSRCSKVKYEYGTNRFRYEFAITSRDKPELCGPEGKHYELDDKLLLK
jgi:hypothetical protein